MRVSDLEKSTEAFMVEVVLRDPGKAAVVLKVATGIGASPPRSLSARARAASPPRTAPSHPSLSFPLASPQPTCPTR